MEIEERLVDKDHRKDTPTSNTTDLWSNKPTHKITDIIESKSSYIIKEMVELAEKIGVGYEEDLEFIKKRAEAKNVRQMEDDWVSVSKEFFLCLENKQLAQELEIAKRELEKHHTKTAQLEQALNQSQVKQSPPQEASTTENKLYSVKEVSKLLNICTSTVYNLIESKQLNATHIGRTIRIKAESVRALAGPDIC